MRSLKRCAYIALFLGLGAFYYEFLGAGPTPSEKASDIRWWRPAGWALNVDSPWLAPFQRIAAEVVQARHEGRIEPRGTVPFALFALPPVAMTALGFALFASVVARAAALALGLALVAFSYYGWLDAEIWQDYTWRWPAVLLATAAYTSLFALGPAFVRAARERSAALQLLAAATFVASIYFLSIEVTGTNPELEWNISPWPTLTLYGFLLIGLVIAVVLAAAGAGMLAAMLQPGLAGRTLGVVVAILASAALQRIPFAESGPVQIGVVAVPAAALVLLATRSSHAPPASAFLVAGLLTIATVKLGQWQGEYFQAQSRDVIAPRIIEALERYRADHDAFPDELTQLVPHYLPEVPLPRVGWFHSADETFLYTYLGESFLLEFPSIVWVQCAYSPAVAGVEEDLEEPSPDTSPTGAAEATTTGAAEEKLEASWSCESKPPRLW